jgi:large subunit ribosomal protein L6
MSRIGNKPISVPKGVDVTISGSEVAVKGPKGELQQRFDSDMAIAMDDGAVAVKRPSDEGRHRALHGLTRSLLANMVLGVSEGYVRQLDLVGVGYRAQQEGLGVTLNVMLSHTVTINPPEGVTIEVEGQNLIRVSGIDKQKVGQLAAQIRKVRPPNAYTGKGIRYSGEQVKLKPGKSARRVQ